MYPVILAFIGLSSTLVWYLLRHDHGRKLPVATLWMAAGFGVLAVISSAALERYVLPHQLFAASSTFSLGSRFFWFMAVGAIEELTKFVPLALYIRKKTYFDERTDGVIYFAICGLSFGLCENILYTFSLGAKAGLLRLIMTPFFHASCTAVIGYYLASYKLDKKLKARFIGALVLIPFLHGFYDFGLDSQVQEFLVLSLMTTLLLTMGLFLYFMQANDFDKQELAFVPIVDRFCSRCGRQNQGGTMFCEYCGNRL